MELNELAQHLAAKHVAQSLAEMSDPAKVGRWENGERAKEAAAEIAAQLVAEAHKALEQKENDHEKPKA